jgi:uncharacterized protein involved in exopolysaccharide biosynthesis
MVAQRPDFERPVEGDEDSDAGFDFEQLVDFGGFVLRSARRRPKLTIGVFVVVAALGITIGKAMPVTYNSQVKLLAQRSTVLRTLSGMNCDINLMDNPTKNAADLIMRRDNLVALVKEIDLVDRFEATRPPLLSFRDSMVSKLGGQPTEDDKIHALVATLESKLTVTADEANVTISVDWPDARLAYDLATLIQKNFLEARYDSEISVVTDSITVLQEHAKDELAKVDAALAEYERLLSERASRNVPTRTGATRWVVPGVSSSSAQAMPVDPDIAQALEEKRQRIRVLEAERQRELETLRQQLAQAQLTLTPLHPTVAALQHQVDTLSLPTPELAVLKAEERTLVARMTPSPSASAHSAPAAALVAIPAPPEPAEVKQSAVPAAGPEDGPTQLAHTKLDAAMRDYQEVMNRIEAANIELDITRTAFKYRYTVVTPAEIARKPKKPIAEIVAAGGVLGGAALALLVAAFADLATGLVLESWQIRRRLKLEVLGDVVPPS